MKYVLAAFLAFVLGSVAMAAPKHAPHHGKPHHHPHHNYHQHHGHKFQHGHYYKGRSHNHWSHRQWHSKFRCWVFFDSGVRVWYYYCVPAGCFYPIGYCPYGTYHWSGDAFCCP